MLVCLDSSSLKSFICPIASSHYFLCWLFRSLRLWFRPTNTKAGATDRAATAGKDGGIGGLLLGLLDEEEDEEAFVSNYEKQHPLEVPRALTEANQWQLLKAIGVLEDDKATTGRKGRQRALKVWMWMVVSAHLHASTWLLCVSMQNGSRGRMITGTIITSLRTGLFNTGNACTYVYVKQSKVYANQKAACIKERFPD
eukprot:1159235-Pelagomonas_calceolata.AAC.2